MGGSQPCSHCIQPHSSVVASKSQIRSILTLWHPEEKKALSLPYFPLFINPFVNNNASMHHFILFDSLLNCFICLFYSLNLIILGYLLLSFKFSLV